MFTHRYLVADLVTDTTLGWLPLGGVSYSRRIAAQGDFTGSFPIANRHLGELTRLMVDRPLALYAQRISEAAVASTWWGGIIWSANPASAKRGETARCDVVGATFDSLPENRRIFTDLTFAGLDRGEALAQLWDQMQADGPNAGAGIDVGTPTVGGDTYSKTWSGWAAPTWAEAMADVINTEPVFESTIDVWTDGAGGRHRALRVGAPLIGDQTADPHLICTPRTVQSWTQPSTNTRRPTYGLARGATTAVDIGGETTPVLSPIVVDQDAYDAGAPRVDAVVDLADTEDPTRLLGAATNLLRPPGGVQVPSVTVRLRVGSPFTPGNLGERGRVILEGPMFDSGSLDTIQRIIGVQVSPAERGRPETVTFEFQTGDAT